MVSDRTPRRKPTHSVTYGKFQANLYIAASLQQQLEDGKSVDRKQARDSVCIKFQRACSAKYGREWARRHPFIKWGNLTVAPLEPAVPRQLVTRGECCDNERCFVCSELNNHHQCSLGCTLSFDAA